MAAALDQSHLRVKAGEELRELDRHGAAAENDQRLRRLRQGERFVAGEITGFLERGQGRRGDDRACADDEIIGGERFTRAERDGVRVVEPGGRPHEFEFAVRELLDAVMGEVLNHRVFSRHDPREIEVDLRNADAPGPRVSREMDDIRRVEQRLGRHAAAQDAKPADLFTAFDDGRF